MKFLNASENLAGTSHSVHDRAAEITSGANARCCKGRGGETTSKASPRPGDSTGGHLSRGSRNLCLYKTLHTNVYTRLICKS